MELSADCAGALGQHALDRRVHVLRVGGPGEGAILELRGDALKLAHQRRRLVLRDDALTPEHARVRDAAAHVVRGEAFIELERRGEVAHLRIERAFEAPLPQVLAHLVFFFAFGASSDFRGTSSIASLPSPQRACVRACVRSGKPKTVMKPSDAL